MMTLTESEEDRPELQASTRLKKRLESGLRQEEDDILKYLLCLM